MNKIVIGLVSVIGLMSLIVQPNDVRFNHIKLPNEINDKIELQDIEVHYEMFNYVTDTSIPYERFKQIEVNDFNSDYKFEVVKKKTSALTVFRIIRLITIGVN